MSGGVDSTMAAFLLKKKGFEVIGLTMAIWNNSPNLKSIKSGCYGPGEAQDIKDAKRAAKLIGIPHYVIDLKKEYQQEILSYFKEEYKKGKTPNPCIMCNARMKFGLLLEKAFQSGLNFDYFATGHYAKILFDAEKKLYLIKKGADKTKDQSYFLYRLRQQQLKKIIFPLGNKRKKDIKKIASENGFTYYADKEESQDFAECGHSALLPNGKPGKIVDYLGNVLGKHKGIEYYTIGQRKNLNLGGLKDPYYVLKIDAKNNSIIVGPKELVYSSKVSVSDLNWIIPPEKIAKNICEVKVRYGAESVKAKFITKGKNKVLLELQKPQFAISPGQSAVFYDKDVVLGGGIISK